MFAVLLKTKAWLRPNVLDADDRLAWPEAKVLAYLREQSGRHFDPQVVAAFLKLVDGDTAISSRG